MINTDYNYKKEIINDSYMFKFKDEFLVNLSFMPIKKQVSKSKVFYDWEKVIDVPIIILDTKNHDSYKFFITYESKKSGNIIVSVKYKDIERNIKYDSLIKGYYKNLVDSSFRYDYDIGYTQDGWEVMKHLRNSYGRKRYLLKDLTVKDDRYIEIDENKIRERGFPKQKKKLKDVPLYNKVSDKKYLEYYKGSGKLIGCFCSNCEKLLKTQANNITKRVVYCEDCTKSISFPERVMRAVLEYNNIEYDSEVKIKELGQMRIDFVVNIDNHKEFIEVNGAQHTNVNHKWYEHSIRADLAKQNYAHKNNIPIHFVDAKESDVNYILKSIKDLEIDYLKIDKESIVKILKRRNVL